VYRNGDVSIGPPEPDLIRSAPLATDIAASVATWLDRAEQSADTYYFSIFWRNTLVGQILLHDADWGDGESLIGYHLFAPEMRGQGIGTQALDLLLRFVAASTTLTRLVIITSQDNQASQRIAEKCGFRYVGSSREDPINGVVFQRVVGQPNNPIGVAPSPLHPPA
jgi:RimJ/RimL family protein N-acetyltransferase